MDQLGDCQPNDQFQADRNERKVQRPPDGLPESRVLQHRDVVAEAHEGAYLVDAGGRILETEDKCIDDRPERYPQDDEQARGKQ